MQSKPSQVWCAHCGKFMEFPHISHTDEKLYHKECLPEERKEEAKNGRPNKD